MKLKADNIFCTMVETRKSQKTGNTYSMLTVLAEGKTQDIFMSSDCNFNGFQPNQPYNVEFELQRGNLQVISILPVSASKSA